MRFSILIFLFLFLFLSCARRNLTYFSNYDQTQVIKETIGSEVKDPIIQPGDLLQITVTSSNPEAAVPFNRISQRPSLLNTSETNSEGYLVDKDGIIDFPIIGGIKLGGSSKSEAKLNLTNILTQYLGEPIVTIRYLNYRITVIGEVKSPNTFLVPSERISIIEALGMAGDLTVYGKRENVMVINQNNGVRTIAHLNLNDKAVLDSPFFYLKPNDIVYVEPLRSRKDQASLTRSNISLMLGVITAASLAILTLR